ncbi:hypothetical protein Poly21_38920 [Allorhodopirellula heiligendammensis]|uniref:Uncharacterized protein n=2 Tax=Allorhodopirellula heiligendammensis TaxID=2714739 RepID=A0A5C6BYC9_9BACT|nr:hypothetical protein Poly21_38920 [Allorhodopirellula heiligendammensis]
MRPAEIFQVNLQKFALAKQIESAESLANSLGFCGDDKKWVQRIWRAGLARVDTRTRPKLERLTEFFRRDDVSEFWQPNVEIRPSDLLDNRDSWSFAVKLILNQFRFLQQAKIHSSTATRKALAQYGFQEELLIGDLAARQFGAERPALDELSLGELDSAFDGFCEEWKFNNYVISGDERENPFGLYLFVVSRVSEHPKWQDFVESLKEEYRERGMADTGSLDAHVKDRLMMLVDELKLLPQSPEQILDLFIRFYIDDESTEQTFLTKNFEQVVEEIALHPQWPEYVRRQFGVGCYREATEAVLELWDRAVRQLGTTIIRPEHFISYFCRRLDALKDDDLFEKRTGDND